MNAPCFVLDRHLNVLANESILTLDRPVFALTHECCVLSGEAVNTSFNAFGLTRLEIESTTFRTRGEHANNYTTEAV